MWHVIVIGQSNDLDLASWSTNDALGDIMSQNGHLKRLDLAVFIGLWLVINFLLI